MTWLETWGGLPFWTPAIDVTLVLAFAALGAVLAARAHR